MIRMQLMCDVGWVLEMKPPKQNKVVAGGYDYDGYDMLFYIHCTSPSSGSL